MTIENVILKIRNKESDQNYWGWEFVKVLKVLEGRTIEWAPNTKRDDPDHKHFWDRLPNGDIHKITTKEIDLLTYCYDLNEKGEQENSNLERISEEDFWNLLCYEYDVFTME